MNLRFIRCDDIFLKEIRFVYIDALIGPPKEARPLGSRGGWINKPALECGARQT